MTPSLGSTPSAISATCAGVNSRPIADAVATMAAETSAVLLAIPLPRGSGESSHSRASIFVSPR